VHLGGYTERDAGAFNLKVDSADKVLFSIMPGLEVGGQLRDGSGTIWRPYARAGVTFFSSDSMSVAASFANAPAGVSAFNMQSKLDTVFADVEAGTHVLMMNGLNVRLNYEGRFGENTRQHGGTVKLGLPY
jgi:outer membrane autotransporter protein